MAFWFQSSTSSRLAGEDLHRDWLHHAPAVAEYVASKRVENLTPGCPSDRPVNGGLTHTVATVVNERLPFDVAASRDEVVLSPEQAARIDRASRAAISYRRSPLIFAIVSPIG